MDPPNENAPQESHNLPKKTRSRLQATLAFRVLFISFLFIILPLIIYSLIVYSNDYHRRLGAIFTEMKLFQEDQLEIIKSIEDEAKNFLTLFVDLSNKLKHSGKALSDFELEPILLRYTENSELSAIFLLEVQKNGALVCTKSTLTPYKGVDFSSYFPKDIQEQAKAHLFFAKDPVFGHSLFVMQRLPYDLDQKEAFTVVSISIDVVLSRLYDHRTIKEMNLSVIDEQLKVIATTDFELLNQQLTLASKIKKQQDLVLVPTRTITNGFKYFFKNKKRFVVIARMPNTDVYLFTSVPSQVLLVRIFEQLHHLGIFLACVLIFGGAAAMLFTRRISRPLQQLSSVMHDVGEGTLEARYKRDRMGFEINFLGEKFNQMVNALISYIEEVKRERASKEAYAKELQIGHEIQQSILPRRDTKFPGIDSAVFFEPAKEVAGDFFDWMVGENEIFITIADGVGKGVSGALYAFDLRSILRSFATTHQDLGELVIKANALFCEDTKETGNFVTAFLARYDGNKQELQYVNCGHNYPYILRASGEIERLESKGIAFGVDHFDHVDVRTVPLKRGDFILLYTDGITEAQNTQGELYTEKRLIEVLTRSKHDYAETLLHEIMEEIQMFTKDADQYDDMTFLIFKIKS